jgi:hypothetical protein
LYCEHTIGKRVCKNTIRKAFRSLKLGHWRALKRIFLNNKAILGRNTFWRFWRRREEELCQVSFCFYTGSTPQYILIYPANYDDRESTLTNVLLQMILRILLAGFGAFPLNVPTDEWLI